MPRITLVGGPCAGEVRDIPDSICRIGMFRTAYTVTNPGVWPHEYQVADYWRTTVVLACPCGNHPEGHYATQWEYRP